MYMLLRPYDYLNYIRTYKTPSQVTLRTYEQTLKHIAIESVDTDVMSPIYKQLLDGLIAKRYGYPDVERFIVILSAWAKKQDSKAVLEKELAYSKLRDYIKLVKKGINRQAYSDDELTNIFVRLQSSTSLYNGLYHLCLLLLYSGLRISAAHNIKWSDVKPVPENERMYYFPVRSKGVDYFALCRADILGYILANSKQSDTVIYYDPLNSSSFDTIYRDQFLTILRNAWIETKGHSVFHSFRKSFAQKLFTNPDVDPRSLTYMYMMGHVPKETTAIRFYIMPNGQSIPLDLIKKCAIAYLNSELGKMRIGLPEANENA